MLKPLANKPIMVVLMLNTKPISQRKLRFISFMSSAIDVELTSTFVNHASTNKL